MLRARAYDGRYEQWGAPAPVWPLATGDPTEEGLVCHHQYSAMIGSWNPSKCVQAEAIMAHQLRLITPEEHDRTDDPYALAVNAGNDPRMYYESTRVWYRQKRWASILEARTAYFLDQLGVKYDPEPMYFQTSAGRYTPDMDLPDHGCFLECKPGPPWEGDLRRMAAAADVSQRPILIVPGVPAPELECWIIKPGGTRVAGVHFAICPHCGENRVGFIIGQFLQCPHRQDAIPIDSELAEASIWAQRMRLASAKAKVWLFLDDGRNRTAA